MRAIAVPRRRVEAAEPVAVADPAGAAVSRLELVLSVGLIFVVAVAVRVWAAAQVTFPAPEDTAYYVGLARNLLAGRGLVSDALWTYGTGPLVLPHPGFEVWLPLPTFLAAVPMALLGATFAAAQWSSVLVGSLMPVLAWRLAADLAAERAMPVGRARTLAVGTGLASAVYLPLVLHSALPDSTMLFGVLALGAALLMTRVAGRARDGGAGALRTRPLVALGLLIGLAALTRNEAIWLGFAWLVLAWRLPLSRAERIRAVALPGLVAAAVFAPWAIRNWTTFGTPLPGQALSNALSLDGRDIFAWADRPTIARYLDAGPGVWLGTRITGTWHNLFSVLLALGVPTSVVGLVGLPWIVRARAIVPLALVSGLTFLTTSLVFPVSTTWGTYLHAAAPAHVLLVLSCLVALDALIARIGAWRGWTRPVAWLGPALAVTAGVLFTAIHVPTYAAQGELTAAKFQVLRDVLPGYQPGGPAAGPIITDVPIWLAEETGFQALALPNEPPAVVLDLAAHFPGTSLLVVDAGPDAGSWPAILSTGAAGADCFERLPLPEPADPYLRRAVEDTQLYRVGCR